MGNKTETTIYKKAPLKYFETIPIFSEDNNYTQNYEKISGDHLEHFQKFGQNPSMDEVYWNEIEDSTVALVNKYSKSGDKILDVGVGLGRLLSKISTPVEKFGCDISYSYLKVASGKGINCCYSLIEDMPYHEESFDIIVCTDVLEHVLDLNIAVSNILKVLKKGGLLIIRVPYQEDLSQYLDENCPYEFVHLRNFDENSLKLFFTKIFKCKFLEFTLSGVKESVSMLKYPIPPLSGIGRFNLWYFQLMQKFNRKKFLEIMRRKEINFVVKKITK